MCKFKVGDEVVVRSDSRFYEQRKYGKAVIESVLGPDWPPDWPWDVSVRYEGSIGLFYKFHDLDRVVKFKGNIK